MRIASKDEDAKGQTFDLDFRVRLSLIASLGRAIGQIGPLISMAVYSNCQGQRLDNHIKGTSLA